MPPPLEPHAESFAVRSYEVDPRGRLTLRALSAYLQEAAGHDAARLGVSTRTLAEQGLAWVLHRLKLELRSQPVQGDALRVLTWPRLFERVVANRDFEVQDGGGRVVAVAASRWAMVDLAARRVVRLPDFIRGLPVGARPPALEIAGELPRVERPQLERRFEVRRADLDATLHVNNTHYVAWILETVPEGVLDARRPVGFEVLFRQESVYGDAVVSRAQSVAAGGSTAFAHVLTTADARELVQAVSLWE